MCTKLFSFDLSFILQSSRELQDLRGSIIASYLHDGPEGSMFDSESRSDEFARRRELKDGSSQ